MSTRWIGLAAVAAIGISVGFTRSAAGSIAYGINSAGTVIRFDPYSNDIPVQIGGGGWTGFASGLAIDAGGVGWAVDWTGFVRRYDLQAGTSSAAGALPVRNGWYKDMAWDPANQRVLAMHFSGTVDIGVVNTGGPMGFTSLGSITGMSPIGHVTGMAVAPDGTITIADQALGLVWDLTPEAGGLHAVRRAHQTPGGSQSFEGLDYDPATGELLGSSPVARVLADGSLQPLRNVGQEMDIAFAPVPGPSAMVVLGAGGVLAYRRRRVK